MRLHTGLCCTGTVRESALKADSGRKIIAAPGTGTPVSIQLDAVPRRAISVSDLAVTFIRLLQ